jgi:hypothetical protein
MYAADKPLYDMLKESVEMELGQNGYDDEIVLYLTKVFKEPESVIRPALAGGVEFVAACETAGISDRGACYDLILRIIRSAKQEAAIRKLGKQLQEAAGGEEVPVSYIPGRAVSLFFDLSALVNIWAPGDKAPINFGDDTSLTIKRLPDDLMDTHLDDLNDALTLLPDDERVAAVWRYDGGLRLVDGKRGEPFKPPFEFEQNGPGKDLQLLNKRWKEDPSNIEDVLQKIWNDLPPDDTIENRITYYSFPKLEEKMPENILVWARKGKRKEKGKLVDYGDVGLAWKTPLLPVFPALLTRDASGEPKDAILGGFYPPEPVEPATRDPIDGRKLCSDPVASKGYLCQQANAKGCPVPASTNPDAITLTECERAPATLTLAGADVCREIKWRSSPPYDRKASSFNPKEQCYLSSLTCKSGFFSGGRTEEKKPDGGIAVSVNPMQGVMSTYLWIHELVHAYQECTEPPGSPYITPPNPNNPLDGLTPDQQRKNIETCCRLEGEAYRVQCDAMEEDGLFFDQTTGTRRQIMGVPLTATVCAEAFTDYSCNERVRGRCPRTFEYPGNAPGPALNQLFVGQIDAVVKPVLPATLPSSCSAAIAPGTRDPRVQARIETIEVLYNIADPLNATTYRNSLGNNFCYAGQAAEDTFDLHNVTGGRTPIGVADQASPWIADRTFSAASSASSASSAKSSPFALIEQPLGKLPPYIPQVIAEQFDLALCQQQGAPTQSPPVLCTLQYGRRLQLPLMDYVQNAQSLTDQQAQTQAPLEQFRDLDAGLGARIGNGIYEQYAPRVLGLIQSLMQEAVRQLELLSTVKFPDTMCPLGPA